MGCGAKILTLWFTNNIGAHSGQRVVNHFFENLIVFVTEVNNLNLALSDDFSRDKAQILHCYLNFHNNSVYGWLPVGQNSAM